MRPLNIACVHGVNTGPGSDYLSSWKQALPPAKLCAVRWPSLDSPVYDWLGIRLSPKFRLDALECLRKQIQRWWYSRSSKDRLLVFAHSMGVPLAMRALTDLQLDIPFVGVGSPMTHPILGVRLEAAGFGGLPGQTPVVFSNRDDFICAIRTPWGSTWWRQPKYLKRSIVEIDAPPHREHDAEKYLALPEVSSCIRETAK